MQANLSFILNVVFLGIILLMIYFKLRPYFFKKKFNHLKAASKHKIESNLSTFTDNIDTDDIIEVRKIETTTDFLEETSSEVSSTVSGSQKPSLGVAVELKQEIHLDELQKTHKNIMLFLAAQGQNTFAGYDLLQTLLSCGLRYGDAGLFHRHQHASGQGPVLFSLAAATSSGMFDLQNMGAMSVKGLCMFMELSGNIAIDSERFEIFVQTARQLAEDLHANLLDERQRPLTQDIIKKIEHLIAETTEI